MTTPDWGRFYSFTAARRGGPALEGWGKCRLPFVCYTAVVLRHSRFRVGANGSMAL